MRSNKKEVVGYEPDNHTLEEIKLACLILENNHLLVNPISHIGGKNE